MSLLPSSYSEVVTNFVSVLVVNALGVLLPERERERAIRND